MEEVGPHGSNPTAISGTSWKKKKIRNKYESLLVEELEQEPEYEIEKSEKLWEILKTSLRHVRDEVIPKKEKKNSKPWMTNDILKLMEKRKMCKRENSINKYKEINKNIKRECLIAKENWYNGKCEELEKLKMWFLRHTFPVFTRLGRCPIVNWDFSGAVSIFGPDALLVVHQ